ncbi:metalloregulator ArsR/SmtB family transcription factor [Corynebacterium nasicanis]|uniref:Metalloregulator ArsR/SmtB family transcription factor n=1 Tax=Corynebacterium nasicanis TaxID=1448267 RepID=A0ABW1QCF2_9CORY
MAPQPARDFKDSAFGHIARVGAALGNAKRIEIMDILLQGERSVEALARQVAASVANTSRHLQILAAAGLVERRAEGTSRVYRIADDEVASTYLAVAGLARTHLAEITTLSEGFFAGARPLTFAEFDRLAATGDILLIDVRPAEEFAAGHAEGALNVPPAEVEAWVEEVPAEARIVAYCRGPFCVFAADAVTRLREAGHEAWRLEEGYPEWREAGRPVA